MPTFDADMAKVIRRDARIIAAAPDMLALLVIAPQPSAHLSGDEWRSQNAWRERVDALLAKIDAA